MPERSARNCKLKSPVIIQSGVVFPSPRPLMGWLLVTEMIFDFGAGSQMSVATTAIVTGTIAWFGAHRVFGVAVILTILGGMVSLMVTVVKVVAIFPE